MPVRVTTASRLAQDLTHTKHWVMTNPNNCTYEEFEHAHRVADAIYRRVVGIIDWNRVVIEAMARHVTQDDLHQQEYSVSEEICGHCVKDALLSFGHQDGYSKLPPIDDWTSDIAECISYR